MKRFVAKLLSKLPLFRWLIARLARNETEIYELQWNVRLLSAEIAFPRKAPQLRQLLAYLKPKKVIGFDKIRVGHDQDGGYIMLNDFASIARAYSLGIADNVSWDLAMADRGILVHQFDYSISKSPIPHQRFTFSRRRVEHIDHILETKEKRQILKIDIEGSEWNFFDEASPELLGLFTQIVGEFHGFSQYCEPQWSSLALRSLRKLSTTHQLIHVHANNGGRAFWADGMQVPDLFELTFALRSEYRFENTVETFPGPLDFRNLPYRDDYPLDELLASDLCNFDLEDRPSETPPRKP